MRRTCVRDCSSKNEGSLVKRLRSGADQKGLRTSISQHYIAFRESLFQVKTIHTHTYSVSHGLTRESGLCSKCSDMHSVGDIALNLSLCKSKHE